MPHWSQWEPLHPYYKRIIGQVKYTVIHNCKKIEQHKSRVFNSSALEKQTKRRATPVHHKLGAKREENNKQNHPQKKNANNYRK